MHSDWLNMKLFMDNLWKSLWKRYKRSKHTKLCRKILFFNLSNFEFCQIPAAANLNVNDINESIDNQSISFSYSTCMVIKFAWKSTFYFTGV